MLNGQIRLKKGSPEERRPQNYNDFKYTVITTLQKVEPQHNHYKENKHQKILTFISTVFNNNNNNLPE